MATWVPPSTTTTGYRGGDRAGHVTITNLTDNNSSNLEFTVGEQITATFNTGDFILIYRGTVTIDGEVYPVLQSAGGTLHYMVGNASGPFTLPKINAVTFTVCFFPGTMIATPSGECKVEELVPGELVMVEESRVVPVKWIGQQTVSTCFGPADRLMPVRFSAGSLMGGILPHSDLTVTADHAMLFDGVLCEAGTLVNGTTITRVPLSEFGGRYTVYHVETEAHEIVFANGAPSETFVDNATRRAFDNFVEFEAIYGDPPEMKELPYPRASNARHLPLRIKARLGLDHSSRRPRRSTS